MGTKRPEPRYTVWVRVGDIPHLLAKNGAATVYDSSELVSNLYPDMRALRATLIVHRPRITKPRKKVKLVGAAAAAVAKAKKARRDG